MAELPAPSAECPHCREAVKPGASICPHCQSRLDVEAPAKAGETVVFVFDRGLIRFGKFAAAVLSVFLVIGVFFFGLDLKQTAEVAKTSSDDAKRALFDLREDKLAFDARKREAEALLTEMRDLADRLRDEGAGISDSLEEAKALLGNIRNLHERGLVIIAAIERERDRLTPDQERIAAAERRERGFESERGKLWPVGAEVRYGFLDGGEAEKAIVRRAFRRWEREANISFVETPLSEKPEVRVTFMQPGSWSYVGTDALALAPETNRPTINLGTVRAGGSEESNLATALHEVGHVVGLVHEFQNPAAADVFNRDAVIQYYSAPPYNWSRSQIDLFILGQADDETYPGDRPFDPVSIMNYPFPGELTKDGKPIVPGTELSRSDAAYVRALYPEN